MKEVQRPTWITLTFQMLFFVFILVFSSNKWCACVFLNILLKHYTFVHTVQTNRIISFQISSSQNNPGISAENSVAAKSSIIRVNFFEM